MINETLVTIHGFWSSPATWERLNTIWLADEQLRGLHVHPFGYDSPIRPRLPFSTTRVPDYDDIAQTLATEYQVALAEAANVAIVTHSQGGLILQRFLAWMVQQGRGQELARIRTIVMLACPNGGSEYLRSIRHILRFGRHAQAGSLEVLNRQVADTQRTVLQHIVNATGIDAHQCRIPFHAYAGSSDKIVTAASAQGAFPGASALAGNHFSILDPRSPHNRTAETIKHHLITDLHALPLTGDQPYRREAHTLTPQESAEAGSAGDVTLTPRQFGDKLVLDVRNNGPAASFTAEVIFIFRSNGDGTPDTTPGWAVPWAANGKSGPSTDAAEIPHGQQRTLDLACYDPAAVQASRSGDTGGPHWLFSSLPEPVGFLYWPPIASGRDLSARRFVVTLRVFRSSPPGWSDHTLGVGVTGSAIVCEPLPLKVEVIETDWRDRELRDFIVAARVQVQNNSGKTVRLSPVHWMQAATPGVIAAEPTDLLAIRAAVSAEQARRTPSLYDRMEIADGEVVRGWIVYGVGRSATGGKPHAFLVIRDEEGNMYPAAVEAATIRN